MFVVNCLPLSLKYILFVEEVKLEFFVTTLEYLKLSGSRFKDWYKSNSWNKKSFK